MASLEALISLTKKKRSHSKMAEPQQDVDAVLKPLPVPNDAVWKETVLPRIPRCDAAEGLQQTSHFRDQFPIQASSSSTRSTCLRRLLPELASLEQDLPHNPAIWLRFDEETPQFLRALVTAPTQTPYSLGLFCFDIYVPDTYPLVPPKFHLLTTGQNTVRFSPNLYQNGRVCLSLLNTWNGPRWNPDHSTLLQCLVSLQGLVLGVEHPYYLEPGHGGWEGHISEAPPAAGLAVPSDSSHSTAAPWLPPGATTTKPSLRVVRFEDKIRLGTTRFAMLDMIRSVVNSSNSSNSIHTHLAAFKDIITAHFYHVQERISQETSMWAKAIHLKEERRQFQLVVKELGEALTKLQPLPALPATDATNSAAASKSHENGDSKMSSESADPKTAAMEEAAAKKDYITAGRLQSEILHANQLGSVESKITSKRNEMELAASKGDYITAGQLQVALQHLESNKKLLQNLEKRMLDSAAKMDFVRAGRFQEQYNILLASPGDSLSSSQKTVAPSVAASIANVGLSGEEAVIEALLKANHPKMAMAHFEDDEDANDEYGDY